MTDSPIQAFCNHKIKAGARGPGCPPRRSHTRALTLRPAFFQGTTNFCKRLHALCTQHGAAHALLVRLQSARAFWGAFVPWSPRRLLLLNAKRHSSAPHQKRGGPKEICGCPRKPLPATGDLPKPTEATGAAGQEERATGTLAADGRLTPCRFATTVRPSVLVAAAKLQEAHWLALCASRHSRTADCGHGAPWDEGGRGEAREGAASRCSPRSTVN